MPDGDDKTFDALTRKISQARGMSCESYKDKCVKRRIAVRMRARGIHTYDEYAKLLDRDAHEYQELLDALTINVTKFFRNAETWDALKPYLVTLGTTRRELRVWSAGCASGEEPYTIAILLLESLGAGRGAIDATDIDRLSLERTRQARYPEAAFSEMPAGLKRRYFRDGQPIELPVFTELVPRRRGVSKRSHARGVGRNELQVTDVMTPIHAVAALPRRTGLGPDGRRDVLLPAP